MADLQRIQAEIAELSSDDREALLAWLMEADRRDWDEQISRDFSQGGPGMKLLGRARHQAQGRTRCCN